jgi:hypothetical protein
MRAHRGVAEIVGFYRPLGFFVSPKTDEEVAGWIARRPRRPYRDESSDYHHPDLDVLAFDRRRTLDLDFESDGLGGDTMYQYELGRLARISRGGFEPQEVAEEALDNARWGPVRIALTIAGVRHERIVGGGNSDWIDWRLLWLVDELTKGRARLHAAAEPNPSQGMYLVFLTPEERSEIERRRGLRFVPLPEQPVPQWGYWWLHPFWIELDASSRLLRSFGVTALDEDDAVAVLRAAFARAGFSDLPPLRRIVRDPGAADGVPEHVAAVGPRALSRGIWFPELGPVR